MNLHLCMNSLQRSIHIPRTRFRIIVTLITSCFWFSRTQLHRSRMLLFRISVNLTAGEWLVDTPNEFHLLEGYSEVFAAIELPALSLHRSGYVLPKYGMNTINERPSFIWWALSWVDPLSKTHQVILDINFFTLFHYCIQPPFLFCYPFEALNQMGRTQNYQRSFELWATLTLDLKIDANQKTPHLAAINKIR